MKWLLKLFAVAAALPCVHAQTSAYVGTEAAYTQGDFGTGNMVSLYALSFVGGIMGGAYHGAISIPWAHG